LRVLVPGPISRTVLERDERESPPFPLFILRRSGPLAANDAAGNYGRGEDGEMRAIPSAVAAYGGASAAVLSGQRAGTDRAGPGVPTVRAPPEPRRQSLSVVCVDRGPEALRRRHRSPTKGASYSLNPES